MLNVKGTVKVKCPYCGHINSFHPDRLETLKPNIVSCKLENRGCGRWFAIQIALQVLTSTYKMIETE